MTYTNFPNGVTSFGVPLVGGVGGIPLTGNWYFVNAVIGSDGNEGTADSPLQTITQAYALCNEGNNDVVVLQSAPTTASPTAGTFRLSSTLTWAKSATHMIGSTAPTMIGQRARISTATGATTNITPLISVTAQGCMFANFSVFQGVGQASTAECLMNVTGQRNYFGNVALQGMGSTAGAGQSGSYVVYLNGGSENTFDNCQIGVDTIARTTSNASIKLRSGATRNIFKNCIFPMLATNAGALFVDANAAASVDRFVWFKNCLFTNAIDSDSSVATTAVIASNAAQGGVAIFDGCTVVGSSNYSATNPDVNVKVAGSVPNGHSSGLALSAATS